MAEDFLYQWTDNPTVSGVSKCDTDVLNDCLMHLKYDNDNFLNKSQITNCITEIPQRINYTFVDGTFTLLKGSILIFPHGTTNLSSTYPVGSNYRNSSFKVVDRQFASNKFFVWAEIQKNIVLNQAGTVSGTNNFFFVDSDTATIAWYGVGATHSGETVPTSGQCWYDTTNNIINISGNSFSTYNNSNFSLPICDFSREAGVITSINQVFNGFGYIGSTLWADKGIKALISNGRNADRTLKNIEITTDSVKTATMTTGRTNTWFCIFSNKNLSLLTSAFHDEKDNYIRQSTDNNNIKTCVPFATGSTDSTGRITAFNPYLPFRAVDYKDFAGLKDDVKGLLTDGVLPTVDYSAPITISITNDIYTAPSDGYLIANRWGVGNSTKLIIKAGSDTGNEIYTVATGEYPGRGHSCFLPLKKGQVIHITVSGTYYIKFYSVK